MLWVGAGFYNTLIIMPALKQAGTGNLPVLRALYKGPQLALYMGGLGLLTVLSGVYVYWRLGYLSMDHGVPRMMLLNVGVVAGILLFLSGMAFHGPADAKVAALLAESPPDLETRLEPALQRVHLADRISTFFGLVALVAMAGFRYV